MLMWHASVISFLLFCFSFSSSFFFLKIWNPNARARFHVCFGLETGLVWFIKKRHENQMYMEAHTNRHTAGQSAEQTNRRRAAKSYNIDSIVPSIW